MGSGILQGALNILEGLTKVKRFTLTLMLMSRTEKQGLETLFYWLEYSSDVASHKVLKLRSKYQLA